LGVKVAEVKLKRRCFA